MNQSNPTPKIYKLDSTIEFGKHKGKTIRQLIRLAPEYLWWAKENVDGFRLEQAAIDALEDAMMDFREM